MKKILTILVLAGAILAGGMNIYAKTSKKSRSHSTQNTRKSTSSLSLNIFVQYKSYYYFKNLNTIYEILNDKGYSYLSHENDGSETIVTFYKKSNKISITYDHETNVKLVEIQFGSSNEKNSFLKTIQNSERANLFWEEKGNTIILECREIR